MWGGEEKNSLRVTKGCMKIFLLATFFSQIYLERFVGTKFDMTQNSLQLNKT